MTPLDLVKLTPLMQRTSGTPNIKIGLIDGPVLIEHPDLATESILEVPGELFGTCAHANSAACIHGTFIAGILCAKRSSPAPAICPKCTLLVRPIFSERITGGGQPRQTLNLTQRATIEPVPAATPEDVARAIIETIKAGARVLNLSASLAHPSSKGERKLEEALDYAARRGVITIAAAGNQGTLGSSAITRHPWVIPVAACDLRGRPMHQSNLGTSIGRRGLSAPGEEITSLGADTQPRIFGGTSAATPFVTGAISLLWSEFPTATATDIKLAVTQTYAQRRNTVVPPLLDAWRAYQAMLEN